MCVLTRMAKSLDLIGTVEGTWPSVLTTPLGQHLSTCRSWQPLHDRWVWQHDTTLTHQWQCLWLHVREDEGDTTTTAARNRIWTAVARVANRSKDAVPRDSRRIGEQLVDSVQLCCGVGCYPNHE
jgi:hypothetical protein